LVAVTVVVADVFAGAADAGVAAKSRAPASGAATAVVAILARGWRMHVSQELGNTEFPGVREHGVRNSATKRQRFYHDRLRHAYLFVL
jgi:hypothetical protein